MISFGHLDAASLHHLVRWLVAGSVLPCVYLLTESQQLMYLLNDLEARGGFVTCRSGRQTANAAGTDTTLKH